MRRIFLVLALATFSASCNSDETLTGTSGDVAVRAFVDADGSGDYTSGDMALTGHATLTASNGATRDATLDTSGAATFGAVTPGSYSVTFAGTAPSGTVLGGAATPTVVVPFAGGETNAEFRYVYQPGSVSGVLFRDNNTNGVFDAGVDTPAPGMAVALYSGTTTTGTPLAAATSGNAGDFHFSPVRPGQYSVVVTPIPTIQIVGGNTQPVNVAAAAATPVPVRFTGNLLTSIAEARTAAAGGIVAFAGVASADAGLLASNNLYVQDATGGVLVFGAPTSGIVAGDTVRVIGAMSAFNGELEIAAPAGGTLTVTKTGHGTPPAPRSVTIPELVSNNFAGQLVHVSGARVVSVASTGATSYNVNFKGLAAPDTFQVRVGNTTTIPVASSFWEVGRAYDITGVDGVFKGEAQLKPRSAADAAVAAVPLTIAAARIHPAGDTVTVEGVVYVGTGVYTASNAANLNAYIQDATGGTQIFNVPTGTTLLAGDSIRVHGLVSIFSGEYEIARYSASSPLVIDKLGTGAMPAPRAISAAELAAKTYDGQLVHVTGLTVQSLGTVSGTGGYNVVATAAGGAPVTIRIDNTAVGIASSSWQIGQTYDVTGAALNFTSSGTTTPEIKPRSSADVSQ